MLRFILTHPRILGFGVLLTLFSSFGQTFLISIFVPRLLESFGLGTAAFGMLYAVATLGSAFCLPYFGRLIDRVPLGRFCLFTGLGLVAACVLMATARNVPMLFLAILLLRLTGQGLLSLTASTTMARVFDQGRGKALGVSSLGYPLGEGLLPLAVVLLIPAVGWRASWLILAAVILCVLLPAMHSMVGRRPPVPAVTSGAVPRPGGRMSLLRDRRFLLMLPGLVAMPLLLTALFLYQIPLGESRGWLPETMAAAFVGFAVTRIIMSFVSGPLIDRWGALRVFPFILVPALFGLAALLLPPHPAMAFAYLILVGVSQGMAGPVGTAAWAEIYGVEALGAIKGTAATVGILATAVGPLLLGALLAAGAGFPAILLGGLAVILAATACSVAARRAAV